MLIIVMIYLWIHVAPLVGVLTWILVRRHDPGCYKTAEIVMYSVFVCMYYTRFGNAIFSYLQNNALRTMMLNRALETDASGAMSALLFASSHDLQAMYRHVFLSVGMMHVWVVSGYHLQMMYQVLLKCSKHLGGKRLEYGVHLLLLIYVWVICAGSIPLVRAWLARMLRHLGPWQSFLWVWYILLCLYPSKSLHPSLVLSLCIAAWLQMHRHHGKHHDSGLIFSMQAWTGMMYPCLSYGLRVHPWGWCIDFMWSRWVMKLMLPVMWLIWCIGPGDLSQLFGMFLVRWMQAVQASRLLFPNKMIDATPTLYLFVGFVLMVMNVKSVWKVCLFWVAWSFIPVEFENYLHMFDVGRGQSILWVHGHHAVLLDTGDRGAAKKIIKYLQNKNIMLDAIFISHHDQDHMGGLEMLRGFLKNPLQVWIPEGSRVSRFPLNGKVYKNNYCYQGMTLVMGEYRWSVVHPDHLVYGGNDQSCVWRLDGPEHWLFPGDISSRVELFLLKKSLFNRTLDGLVLSHHGSKTSNHIQWLATLNPSIILISSHARSWEKKKVILERFNAISNLKQWHMTSGGGDVHIKLQSGQ